MDYSKLKKPPQLKEDIWRQHLNWMEVVGKQLNENTRLRRKQLEQKKNAAPITQMT